MLKNYFKIALKVMMRKKFFSFISLFGISFTLMILMILTAFLNTELGNNAPMSKKDKMVFIDQLSLLYMRPDTTMVLDSTYVGEILEVDTSYTYDKEQTSRSSSSPSLHFLEKHMKDIKAADNYSFYSNGHSYDVFLNNNKLTLEGCYTDANFWEIFDFQFIEGNAFVKQQLDNQEPIAVITERAAIEYFGRARQVLGEEIELDRKIYKVSGLVKTPTSGQMFLDSDVYIPYTNMHPKALSETHFLSNFHAVYLGSSPSKTPLIKSEIEKTASFIKMPNPERYNELEIYALSFVEDYAHDIVDHDEVAQSKRIFAGTLIGLLALFFLLPILNLINVNISRIMERSSEIGVRKAFGADAKDILFQFVFENILLTIIGGMIGFLLAFVLLYLINSSQVLPDTILAFDYKVFLYSIAICLLFGVLSGLLPAYRMSKIHIVNALKQNIYG